MCTGILAPKKFAFSHKGSLPGLLGINFTCLLLDRNCNWVEGSHLHSQQILRWWWLTTTPRPEMRTEGLMQFDFEIHGWQSPRMEAWTTKTGADLMALGMRTEGPHMDFDAIWLQEPEEPSMKPNNVADPQGFFRSRLGSTALWCWPRAAQPGIQTTISRMETRGLWLDDNCSWTYSQNWRSSWDLWRGETTRDQHAGMSSSAKIQHRPWRLWPTLSENSHFAAACGSVWGSASELWPNAYIPQRKGTHFPKWFPPIWPNSSSWSGHF